ncbi:MAG: zf-HC2 domain-containing protein [Actinomycetota bacterium]
MLFDRIFRRNQMTCGEVMEVLQAYLDGEVDADQARRIAAHLDRCAACDNEASVFGRIKVSLSTRQRSVDPQILDALTSYSQRLAQGEEV